MSDISEIPNADVVFMNMSQPKTDFTKPHLYPKHAFTAYEIPIWKAYVPENVGDMNRAAEKILSSRRVKFKMMEFVLFVIGIIPFAMAWTTRHDDSPLYFVGFGGIIFCLVALAITRYIGTKPFTRRELEGVKELLYDRVAVAALYRELIMNNVYKDYQVDYIELTDSEVSKAREVLGLPSKNLHIHRGLVTSIIFAMWTDRY